VKFWYNAYVFVKYKNVSNFASCLHLKHKWVVYDDRESYIDILDLTRISCEESNYRFSAACNRTCDPAIPVQHFYHWDACTVQLRRAYPKLRRANFIWQISFDQMHLMIKFWSKASMATFWSNAFVTMNLSQIYHLHEQNIFDIWNVSNIICSCKRGLHELKINFPFFLLQTFI
jgi:hypothetical protein